MKQQGLDEETRKVPLRVETRKVAVGSDKQFARFVRTLIVREIRNGARTFGDLLMNLPSIYPTDALAAMDRMQRLPGVDTDVLERIRRDARVRPQGSSVGGSLLPLPHPLDFEWRFSDETCREMLIAASEMTRKGEMILLYGTPGLAYSAISLPVRNRRVVFVGEDNTVTQRLIGLNKAAGRPISMVVEGNVRRECASAVLVDPPWYPDYLNPMFKSAVVALRLNGVILGSLPPLGIRPGVAEERDVFDMFTERHGLEQVDLEELAISYETPFFEENALAAVGVYSPAVWRRGDLAIYRRRKVQGDEGSVPQPNRERWKEVEIEGMRIRIRLDTGVLATVEDLQSLVRGDILPSVSRRDPRRSKANVWTSGNRIYRAGNPMVALEAAHACRDGPTRSVWRNLVEEDAFTALVSRIRRIATTEGEERARFARGTVSRFGRAA